MDRLRRWLLRGVPVLEAHGVAFIRVPEYLADDDLLAVADALHAAWPRLTTEQQRLMLNVQHALEDVVAERARRWIAEYADTVAAWEHER